MLIVQEKTDLTPNNGVENKGASSRVVVTKKWIGVVPVRNPEEDAVKGGKQKPSVVAIEKLGLERGPMEGDLLEELARYGARLVLSRRNCSGGHPKAGGYLRGFGGLPDSGPWVRIRRC